MYETFQNTAEVGLRVRALDLEGLFEEAGRGLFGIIVENIDEVHPVHAVTFELYGKDRESLLLEWLNQLLKSFAANHFVLSRFDVYVNEVGLRATAHGEPLSSERHQPGPGIESIVSRGLSVTQTLDGWELEVLVKNRD